MNSPFVQAVGADEMRAATWRAALERHAGNITHASTEFGFSKQRGHTLTRRHGLVEDARRLRKAVGQASTGRPRRRAL